MSFPAAEPPIGAATTAETDIKASATPAATTAAAAVGPSSCFSGAVPNAVSPTYTFSAEAPPFIPSFMRSAPTLSRACDTVSSGGGVLAAENEGRSEEVDEEDKTEEVLPSTEGSENDYREHFSKMWMLCLKQMQGHEVGMLMDMLPLDIQDLYFDKLSDEYLHHDHEHKDKGVHALCAAHKMVEELSPEQLAYIEDFLVKTDALNPAAKRSRGLLPLMHRGSGDGGGDDNDDDEEEENLFINEDDDMGVEEEEWLLEQMMLANGHADAAANNDDKEAQVKKDANPQQRRRR